MDELFGTEPIAETERTTMAAPDYAPIVVAQETGVVHVATCALASDAQDRHPVLRRRRPSEPLHRVQRRAPQHRAQAWPWSTITDTPYIVGGDFYSLRKETVDSAGVPQMKLQYLT